MKQILFVDDERSILDGLKRLLRPMRNEWNMIFAESGQEALEILERASFDAVVSDMRMPRMDGAQLLDEVQRRYPHIVRIILSGHSDQEMIFRSLGATHQFLAKPCETDIFKATIERACALRALLRNDFLQGLVAGMKTIPSLPALYTSIKKEVESESASLKTIEALISKDMGMTAKILQLVNSAYFGRRGNVSTTEQAVKILGLDMIQTLILTAHVISQFDGEEIPLLHLDRLWAQGLETGVLARMITKAEGCGALEIEQAYTAGLLHDVGILLLAANVRDRYSRILVTAESETKSLWEMEQAEFGTSHAEVGAYLLGLWGLSDPIVEAVAYHHRPADCPGLKFSPLAAVHVANVLQQEEAGPMSHPVPALDSIYLERLNLVNRVSQWRKLVMTFRKETAP